MKLNKTLAAVIASAGLGLAGQAMAVGTTAGTTVTNQVSLGYNVNSVPQAAVTQTTEFRVDNRIDMSVASNTATATIVPGQQEVQFQYTISNEGNDTQSFALAIANATTADATNDTTDASALTVTFYLDAAKTTAVPTVGGKQVLALAENAPATPVYAFVTFPTTNDQAAPNNLLQNGDVIGLLMSATAVAADGSAITPDVAVDKNDAANLNAATLKVFAEAVSGSNVAYNGVYTAVSEATISTAKFEDPNTPGASPALAVKVINDAICKGSALVATDNVDKSAGNCDAAALAPANYKPKAIPGAQVQFTYEAENTGALDASAVIFSQVLPAEYLDNSLGNATLSFNGGANVTLAVVTDAPDAANEVRYDSSTGTITIYVGTVAQNANIKITYTAIVQ